MFSTFEIPPQHAETVGARKARKAKEKDIARRPLLATSYSSESIPKSSSESIPKSSSEGIPKSSSESIRKSAIAKSAKPRTTEKGGWFGKYSKKGVQEITALSSLKTLPVKKQPKPQVQEIEPRPRTAPVPSTQKERDPSWASSNRARSGTRSGNVPPPPLSILPPLPLFSAFPRSPMSPGVFSLPELPDGRSQYSPITESSGRITSPTRSVFSDNSRYDSALSEESYDESRLGRSIHFEVLERGSRTGSRPDEKSDDAAAATSTQGPPTQGPFARAVAKMEGAGARIIATRLNEQWDGLDEESYQEVMFEQRLWALTAYQRLTQNKQLQSPAHEILGSSRPEDQRRILHLHGPVADGWMLAIRYPAAIIYTLSSIKTSPTSYLAPLNHHSLYVPSLSSANPFPDNYFDAIVSRSIATILRNDDWARSFFDCMRVLKPEGHVEVLSIDPHLSCEGPKLSSWVDKYLTCRLESHGLSKQASDTVLDTMEIVGLEKIRRARVALPAHSPKAVARPAPPPSSHALGAAMTPQITQDTADAGRMMSLMGRHFYRDMHSRFLRAEQGEEWFWARKDIRDECERYQTKMVMTIACAQKPSYQSVE